MNFILLQYKRRKEWQASYWRHHYQNSFKFFQFMVRQINLLYSKPVINVITNQKLEPMQNVIYHFRDNLEQNNYDKLLIYGLLKDPAMYLDNDILINRKFESHHMLDVDFNLFTKNKDNIYNAGVVWIGRPSKIITKKMMYYRFAVGQYSDEWMNDEPVIDYYIRKNNLIMDLVADVNVLREHLTTEEEINKQQSVHYTCGYCKDLFEEEYIRKYPLL